MPEGPSLVILREEAARFEGQEIITAEGNTDALEPAELVGQPILSLRTFGKQFIVELPDMAFRVHFMLFGSYRIDERKDRPPRLALGMQDGGELNFYGCSIKLVDTDLDSVYDWSGDVMSDQWSARKALKKLRAAPATLACDALLDQTIFAGVGNIVKNEVLFRIKVHPLSPVGALPPAKLRELVTEARQYCFDFLAWKKAFVLRQNWLAHKKVACPRCKIKFTKAHLGTTNRRSFFCESCQKRYPR
ncbi:endonuclease [Massilia eurypsychrophila]|uniref:Endonuclease n=1 Tax=Massilia eurypsychrophila TaxID=1485217 RepID=A0A2G8TDW8_9BURK|nr:DNA-formamidopyrimidine glycosylase family protein [Massilia eurypsychrophila]PIL44184.1 endonuclease [Massilia eurypsychrophila]